MNWQGTGIITIRLHRYISAEHLNVMAALQRDAGEIGETTKAESSGMRQCIHKVPLL
jgi:hypothetical protein